MLSNRHVFWQAFLIAFVIFWFGILIGIAFEESRVQEVEGFYFDSQTDLFDLELSSNIVYGSNLSCDNLYLASVGFADKIYKEASKLEKYDDSNKLTSDLISLHRRYDLMRTSLWMDIVSVNKKCGNKTDIVIYLYDYVDPSLTDRATQGAMSSFLVELKGRYGDDIILIPIAVDTGVESLVVLREHYNLDRVPMIFVNQNYKFSTLDSLKNIESILYNNAS